jgi:hypothetical protein
LAVVPEVQVKSASTLPFFPLLLPSILMNFTFHIRDIPDIDVARMLGTCRLSSTGPRKTEENNFQGLCAKRGGVVASLSAGQMVRATIYKPKKTFIPTLVLEQLHPVIKMVFKR